jgi:hypothetical protein
MVGRGRWWEGEDGGKNRRGSDKPRKRRPGLSRPASAGGQDHQSPQAANRTRSTPGASCLYWNLLASAESSSPGKFDPQTKRCRHYDLRPILCREFGVDSKACQATRKLALGRLTHNSESGVAERVACVGETSRGAATADRTSAPGPSPHGTPIAVFMVWRRLRPLRILDDR